MKKIKEKQTKIEKNYKKSRKNAQKRAVRHVKPETKKVSTHAAKTHPSKRNLTPKPTNKPKIEQKTAKTPRKRRTGQAQRQIKVINIRI